MKEMKKQKGFTLIELLIVIAIIAIIAAVAFVALDPLTRFKDARDSRRWADVSAIMSALKVDQVDNRGSYISSVSSLTNGWVYMIGTGTAACNAMDAYCTTDVTTTTNCVDLTGLITDGYLGAIPTSPEGSGTWSGSSTGYTLTKNTNGTLVIRACENEHTNEITVTR